MFASIPDLIYINFCKSCKIFEHICFGTQIFAANNLNQCYIHQMAKFGQNLIKLLPKDISNEFPSHACMLGNVLETAGIALSHPNCSFDMVRSLFTAVCHLL